MMHTKIKQLLISGTTLFVAMLIYAISFSQSKIDSLLGKLNPQKFAAGISKKAQKLEEKIVVSSQQTLRKLQRQEEKIYRRMLSTKDSLQAKTSLAELPSKYKTLQDKLKNPALAASARQYIPHLDTVSSALKFLDQNGIGGNITHAVGKVTALQDKFQQAEEIRKFIRQRKQQLKEQLEKLGLVKQLKQFNKEIFYYGERLKEYREILKDPKKIERKAIELLSKTRPFRDFLKKNSMLASLFRMPGDPNDPGYQASLAGLQTRAQVNALIQNQIAAAGPNGLQQVRQNIQAAQSQLNELKNKLAKFGAGSSDAEELDFKPNSQKAKSFLKRLEYGANVQTQRATNFFPVTSDLGLSVAYKLNDKSVIGIGASYKMGWGRGWNNIKLTAQGTAIRSFIDWKIKGNLFLSGGYELNHKTAFNSIAQLRDLNAWQQSGLIGLSKSIPVKTKFFKKTKLMMLFDFLSFQQIPKTQSVIFRIGYNF